MNQELIAHLKELLSRVESCPFDLGPIEDVKVEVRLHGATGHFKEAAEHLSNSGTVVYRETDDGKLGWHQGYITKWIEIVAFSTSTGCAVVEPQPLEVGV
jgi:hypothetical protein